MTTQVRLVAMSLLPIDNTTIVYGSGDGGRTIYAENPEFNKFMESAGRSVNIKGHLCGKAPETRKLLYGPTDIEGM